MAKFQVRSDQRDKSTDAARIGSVTKALADAIAAATQEKTLLDSRIRNARDLAAMAAGNDSDEYVAREAKDTQRIQTYEQQLVAGQKRVDELDAQIGNLNAVRELLSLRFPDIAR